MSSNRNFRRLSNPILGPVGAKLGLAYGERAPTAGWFELSNCAVPGRPGDPYWTGCVVGHWLVGPLRKAGSHFKQRTSHVCVSRCGVVSNFTVGELNAGATFTCRGCRPNEHPAPAHRNLPEQIVGELQSFWTEDYMAAVIEEKSNLRGRPAVQDWDRFAMPMLASVVDRTRFGKQFGWKAFVRDCHQMGAKQGKETCRIKSVNEAQRRIELAIHPKESAFTFDVDLTTGRTDVSFAEVLAAVKNALVGLEEEPPPDVTTVVASTAKPSTNGHAAPGLSPLDMSKLAGLRTKIDTLMSVGKDFAELAAMTKAAREKFAAAEIAAMTSREEMQLREEEAHRGAIEYQVRCDRVDELKRKLNNAIVDRDTHASAQKKVAETAAEARKVWDAKTEELKAAAKELVEAEKFEQEQLKVVGEADGLAALIQALSKVSG